MSSGFNALLLSLVLGLHLMILLHFSLPTKASDTKTELSLTVDRAETSSEVFAHIKAKNPGSIRLIEIIRPTELLSEPIPGVTLTGSPDPKLCALPLTSEAAGKMPRLNISYRFFLAENCRLQDLDWQYRSHEPEIDLALKFTVSLISNPDQKISTSALLSPWESGPAQILCRRGEVETLQCSAINRRGGASYIPWEKFCGSETAFECLGLTNPDAGFTMQGELHGIPYTIYAKNNSPQSVFFGDLHVHTKISDARVPVSPDLALQYARYTSLLDFAAITDHAEPVFNDAPDDEDISNIRKAVTSANQEGVFTALFGFEWTSSYHNPQSKLGHRHVIYPGTDHPFCRSDVTGTDTLYGLYDCCRNCLGIVHHPMMSFGPFCFDRDPVPGFENLVEIFSTHGNFETGQGQGPFARCSALAGLRRGYEMRFVAGSDSHFGHPGLTRWPNVTPHSLDGGGLTAVFAENNDRANLYAALKLGRVYATSGPQILLLPPPLKIGARLEQLFPLTIHGTAPLSRFSLIEVHERGEVFVQTLEPQSKTEAIDVLHSTEAGIYSVILAMTPSPQARKFYLRVEQSDQHLAWIGPIVRK